MLNYNCLDVFLLLHTLFKIQLFPCNTCYLFLSVPVSWLGTLFCSNISIIDVVVPLSFSALTAFQSVVVNSLINRPFIFHV